MGPRTSDLPPRRRTSPHPLAVVVGAGRDELEVVGHAHERFPRLGEDDDRTTRKMASTCWRPRPSSARSTRLRKALGFANRKPYEASRIDVSEGPRTLHRVALQRVTDEIGNLLVDEVTTADVGESRHSSGRATSRDGQEVDPLLARRAQRVRLAGERPLARLAGRLQDQPRSLGVGAAGALCGRDRAGAVRGWRPRAARIPGLRRRQVPHRDHARMHRRRRPTFSPHSLRHRRPAWSTCGRALGPHRRGRRPALAEGDE